jgi:hypothetical protein
LHDQRESAAVERTAMDQMSFSDAEYAGKRKKTRREVFLDRL